MTKAWRSASEKGSASCVYQSSFPDIEHAVNLMPVGLEFPGHRIAVEYLKVPPLFFSPAVVFGQLQECLPVSYLELPAVRSRVKRPA